MGEVIPFPAFGKIPRLNREMIITEKIDGTNALVHVTEDGQVRAGSRKRWITPESDNYGFAKWVAEHEGELRELGPGNHYGEWYGAGIQRRYDLDHKRFALFNVERWSTGRPGCCDVVPVIAYVQRSDELSPVLDMTLSELRTYGSVAVPGFMNPEGIVLYHTAARQLFKVLLEGDESPKMMQAA